MQTLNALRGAAFRRHPVGGTVVEAHQRLRRHAGIIAGFATGVGLKLIGYLWDMPAGITPSPTRRRCACSFRSCALRAGHPGCAPRPPPGTDPDPVTFWNSRDTLTQGLGDRWYNSVVLWAGLSACADLGLHGDIFADSSSRQGRWTMNKSNLADLVIRQSEFKGEMGVARADITPPAQYLCPLLGQRRSMTPPKASTARW